MAKRANLRLMAVAILAVLFFSVSAFARLYDGNGTEAEPFIIDSAEKMNDIGNNQADLGSHFRLMADIDLGGYTGTAYNIIGPSWGNKFTGVFDGNDHTIANFTYTITGISNIGLFGVVSGANTEIKNLRLVDPNVDGGTGYYDGLVGAMIGYIDEGIVENCHVEGGSISGESTIGGLIGLNINATITNCSSQQCIVSGRQEVGGLIGFNKGTISDCTSSCTVSGEDLIGGLVGGSERGEMTNCSSSGQVTGTDWGAGGLAGYDWRYNWEGGITTNCYSSANVTGNRAVGGLTGSALGTLSNSFATGNVVGIESVGGLVGEADGVILQSYATGDVNGEENIGGLVGWSWPEEITDCYARGNVTGHRAVGGLLGLSEDNDPIQRSYSTGFVTGNSYIGGFIGESEGGTALSCFWDVITSGQITSAGGIGKATAEMYDPNTFIDADWDFVDLWDINEGQNYPELKTIPVFAHIVNPISNSLITTASIDVDVTFTKEVLGIDSNDMLLDNSAAINAIVGTPINLGGNVWRFPVTGLSDGQLDVNLALEPNSIEDKYGNDVVPIHLHCNVLVLTPLLQEEPEITLGTSNTLHWGPVANADMYYVEYSNEPDFGSIVSNSNWIYGNDFEFAGLDIGQSYWYRAKAKSKPDIKYWMQTNIDEFSQCDLNDVSVSLSPDNVVLNQQPEEFFINNIGNRDRWHYNNPGGRLNCYRCDSSRYLREIKQSLSPRYSATIKFVVYESLSKGGPYQKIYEENEAGYSYPWHRSKPLCVPLIAGRYYGIGAITNRSYTKFLHWFNIRVPAGWGEKFGTMSIGYPATDSFTYSYNYNRDRLTYAQSITTTEKPHPDYYNQGNITSGNIDISVGAFWVDLDFNISLPVDTNLTVDVLDASNDSVIIADANDGEDLSWIDANSIKLRADLSTDDPNVTPALHDWSVSYTDPTTIIESDWSNVVWSMQGTLGDAVDVMLDPNCLKNANQANALTNKIDEVLAMIDAGLYEDALAKLKKDILKKTDGCANNGKPDKNDWIKTCEQQSLVYPLVIETIEYVESLME